MLEKLENRFDLAFSYADDVVRDVRLIAPPDSLDLAETLRYLHGKTLLSFDYLNDRFIAIRKNEPGAFFFCGYVVDRESGEPVAAAVVKSVSGFVTSDEAGYFEIEQAVENTTITILHLSYFMQQVLPTQGENASCARIQLKPKSIELEEILVSNYLAQGINKKVTGEYEVQPRRLQVLAGMSEPDVLHIMQAFPGIQSPNESVSDINIRGGTNDQNLIMWDGIKMYQSSHFYGLITAFNPYFTEEVILTKNGTTARLGEGVSGTIDIRPQQSLTSDLSGGGGINLLSADAYAMVPLSPKASLGISARRSVADFVRTPTYRNYFNRAFRNSDVIREVSDSLIQSDENFYFYDLSARLNVELTEKDLLNFSFINIFNDLNYQENEVIDGVLESRASGLQQKSLASGAGYKRFWSSKAYTELSAYTSYYQLRGVNHDILEDQRLVQENEVVDAGIKLDSRFIINPLFDFHAGVHFTEVGIANLEDLNNPFFRRLVKEVVRSYVFFSEGNFTSPSGKLDIRAGLRANFYQPLNEFLLEPRLAFRRELGHGFSVEILGEYKNQYTTQTIDLQNDFLGVEKRRWVLSNGVDIPIIKSKQISAGFIYNKNSWLISLEGYSKLVDGIITSSQSFQNQFEFLRSAGNYRINGADFLIQKEFNGFSGWLSYAVAENTYEFPELSVQSFPNNLDVLHNIVAGSSYKTNHFQVSGSVNWHSGRPFTGTNEPPIAAGRISYEPPNHSRLKNYFRADVSGRYTFSFGEKINAQAGFSIWNLTGYKNVLNTYFRIDENGQLKQIEQKGLKFTPNAVVRIVFL